ncbi:hypothetical protein ACFC09_27775 [Streptomyces sp. NPDC056161]|uniref:hypothetical protein n=1 Tax=Streptomyces sp. NPDC056161 TaxID=3345732 RepID=UPI0035E2AD3A
MLSARRLAVLVKHLPRDSALNRELHGEAADWSVSDHLLAAAVDHLAAANWMFACVNSEEGDQPEPPAPVPRPSYGDEADGTDEADDADGAVEAATAGAARSPIAEPHPGPDTAGSGSGSGSAPSAAQLARFFS